MTIRDVRDDDDNDDGAEDNDDDDDNDGDEDNDDDDRHRHRLCHRGHGKSCYQSCYHELTASIFTQLLPLNYISLNRKIIATAIGVIQRCQRAANATTAGEWKEEEEKEKEKEEEKEEEGEGEEERFIL